MCMRFYFNGSFIAKYTYDLEPKEEFSLDWSTKESRYEVQLFRI